MKFSISETGKYICEALKRRVCEFRTRPINSCDTSNSCEHYLAGTDDSGRHTTDYSTWVCVVCQRIQNNRGELVNWCLRHLLICKFWNTWHFLRMSGCKFEFRRVQTALFVGWIAPAELEIAWNYLSNPVVQCRFFSALNDVDQCAVATCWVSSSAAQIFLVRNETHIDSPLVISSTATWRHNHRSS